MKRCLNKTLFACLALFLAAFSACKGSVNLGPSIVGVEDEEGNNSTLKHGNDYFINGNGFGVKDPVRPSIWDDFEDGIDTQSDINGWNDFWDGDLPPAYTSLNSRGHHSLNVLTQFWGEGTPGKTDMQQGARIGWPEDIDFTNGYLSFWLRSEVQLHGGALAVPRSVKLLAWFGNIVVEYGTPLGPPKLRSVCTERIVCEEGVDASMKSFGYADENFSGIDPSENAWKYDEKHHRYQSYHEFHGMNVPTSFWEISIDNALWGSIEGVFADSTTFEPLDQYEWVRRFFISYYKGYEGEGCGVGTSEYQIYLDEVYADTTQARIELCDTSSWSNRSDSHCEIQIPNTTWNDTQVKFTANLGSFEANQDVHLFVIDETGTASEGFLSKTGE